MQCSHSLALCASVQLNRTYFFPIVIAPHIEVILCVATPDKVDASADAVFLSNLVQTFRNAEAVAIAERSIHCHIKQTSGRPLRPFQSFRFAD